jgi:hypothetical protein
MAYAVAMESDDKPEGGADKQRIAELEAEVARLKAGASDPPPAQGTDSSEPPRRLDRTTRTKMIVVAAVILVVALGLFSVVFFVLSKGFTSFAHKAAQVIVPTSGTGQGSSSSAPPTPPPEREPTPSAPGL